MSFQGVFLNDADQANLRLKGVISESEVAILRGDVIVAITVIGNNERIVGYKKDILKESKRVLKG